MAQGKLDTTFQNYGIFSAGSPTENILRQVYEVYGVRNVVALDSNIYRDVQNKVKKNGLPISVDDRSITAGNLAQATSLRNNINSIIHTRPVLITCIHGRDRTGFAIAAWLLRNGKVRNGCEAIESVKHLDYGRGISNAQLNAYNSLLGCPNKEQKEDLKKEVQEKLQELKNNASIANAMIKIAKNKNLDNKLNVSPEVIEDLHDSILEAINFKDIKISKDTVEKIGYFAEAISLICDMIIDSDNYDEEEKLKAILDITNNDINNSTAVEQVRESYDSPGGLTQGARSDAGPAGDNVRYFNYVNETAELPFGTSVASRKVFWKALIKSASDVVLCAQCLRNPCSCDPYCSNENCKLCIPCDNKETDINDAFLGGGPQGSPTAEALPSGVGGLPPVGLHDNYNGFSGQLGSPSGTPGAGNAASPVLPAGGILGGTGTSL